jgi:hypothetical protein
MRRIDIHESGDLFLASTTNIKVQSEPDKTTAPRSGYSARRGYSMRWKDWIGIHAGRSQSFSSLVVADIHLLRVQQARLALNDGTSHDICRPGIRISDVDLLVVQQTSLALDHCAHRDVCSSARSITDLCLLIVQQPGLPLNHRANCDIRLSAS